MALTTGFPADDAKPGDDGYLTERQMAGRLRRLRWRIWFARLVWPEARLHNAIIVALLVASIVGVGGSIWSVRFAFSLARRLNAPIVDLDPQLLSPGPMRCRIVYTPLHSTAARAYMLGLPIINERAYPDYRLDAFDVSDEHARKVWSVAGLHRIAYEDVFYPVIPKHMLPGPARYQLMLYGQGDGAPERLAIYYIKTDADVEQAPCHGSSF